MRIAIAGASRAKEIADFVHRHAGEDYMGYVRFDERYVKEKMKKNNYYLVCMAGRKLAGVARLSVVELDLAEIRTFAVDESYRGRGIGTRLLKHALALLKEKKMRKAVARTKAGNAAGLALFLSAGFEPEGYFKEHYRKGVDVIQLGKFL